MIELKLFKQKIFKILIFITMRIIDFIENMIDGFMTKGKLMFSRPMILMCFALSSFLIVGDISTKVGYIQYVKNFLMSIPIYFSTLYVLVWSLIVLLVVLSIKFKGLDNQSTFESVLTYCHDT